MKCPKPTCNHDMKQIVQDNLTPARIQKRFICRCGAYVLIEYDLYEE